VDLVDSALDARQQQLEQWLRQQLGPLPKGIAAGSDAGFRRYFRYQLDGRSVIAMDAPPDRENCRPFVQVANLLAAAGVKVPTIIAEDLQQGFLLLSDLGHQTYLDVMSVEGFTLQQADALFSDAIETLITLQRSSQPAVLPAYDRALLQRELELFPEWYLQRHLAKKVDQPLRALLDQLFQQLIEQILSQSLVYVHRDYMPRNLMVGSELGRGVGVLDFQDAVYGPISYDVASLFKDAFISWPETKVEQWQQQYWQQARRVGLPVPEQFADFQRDCDFIGTQRHLKVIGIFARIHYRDGKPRYLQDVPRFFNYLTTTANRRPELSALQDLLTLLDQR
jgi:aminoglycoside/choline kinase family phosphotransferase